MGFVDLNKITLDAEPQQNKGGGFVDLSTIKLDQAEPPTAQIPMADWIDNFQPMAAAKELGKVGTEYAPEIGLIGGGLIGSMGGPAIAVPASGMGYTAGKMVKSAFEGQPPPTPMEDVTNLGTGMAFEMGGQGVGALASKLFAPAAGKITEGLRSGIDYLKAKGLPFSADIAGTGRISQKVADWMGFGRLYTNHQRGKLVEGLSETVGDISKEIGIVPQMTPTETGTAVADFLQAITQKGPYYENFNNLVKGIPETKWPNTLDAIDALGKRYGWTAELTRLPEEEIAKQAARGYISHTSIYTNHIRAAGGLETSYKIGLNNILNVYGKKKGKPLVDELQGLIENNGLMNGEKAASLINQLWISTKYSDLSGTGKALIGRLKEGFMADMESFAVPGTAETLATIRAAADKATHEALKWIENSSVTGKFLRLQLYGPRKIFMPKWEGHIEEGLPSMITNITKNDVIGLRDRMIEAGKPELWQATQLAYLQKVFDTTVKDGVFDPKKYLTWYDKYGTVASEVMPELAPNLSQWANISQAVSKDYTRNKTGQLAGGLLVGGAIGGLEALRTGDYSKLISVPVAFSTIAALGTMGPGKLGFLRNWALKETSPIAAPAAGIAAKIAGAQLMGNRNENIGTFPRLNK